jgi:hypothetical protein
MLHEQGSVVVKYHLELEHAQLRRVRKYRRYKDITKEPRRLMSIERFSPEHGVFAGGGLEPGIEISVWRILDAVTRCYDLIHERRHC